MTKNFIKQLAVSCLFIVSVMGSLKVFSQGELNCNVFIDASQAQATTEDKDRITELKNVITTFMNSRKWTTDEVNTQERIRCNLSINITDIPGVGSYTATAQIQSSRPVYGSSYETTLLNFVDKDFNFTYLPGTVMDFNENLYTSRLTHLLGFYAYVILGFDYDSFSKLGGTPYFDKVRNIVAVVPTDQEAGWKALDDPNNKGGLSENLNNQLILPMRESMYTYHRLVLDEYLKKPEENHPKVVEVLKIIQQFNNAKRPNAVVVKSFFNAKVNELVGIFSQAPPETQKSVVELMAEMDPSNTQRYERMLEGL